MQSPFTYKTRWRKATLNAQTVIGIVSLQVDGLLVFGTETFRKYLATVVGKAYHIGSQVDDGAMCCVQELNTQGRALVFGQEEAIEETHAISSEENGSAIHWHVRQHCTHNTGEPKTS